MTRQEIIKLAQTSSLSLEEGEIEAFTSDLEKMISFGKQLEDLDTNEVDINKRDSALYNVFRKDEVKPSMAKEELLANAPEQKDGCFFVPQIVE